MSSSYTLLSLLPLLLPLLLLPLLASASDSNNLINQTCKNISKGDPNIKYNFCVYALQSAPASHCANLTRLGLISINLVKNNVTDTKCLIKRLLGDKKVDKSTKVALRDCLGVYSDSISTLGEAARDYRAKRFLDANVKVSSVMDFASSCEDGFEEVEVKSPLTKQNDEVTQLSAIALSIMNMFYHTPTTLTTRNEGAAGSSFGRIRRG